MDAGGSWVAVAVKYMAVKEEHNVQQAQISLHCRSYKTQGHLPSFPSFFTEAVFFVAAVASAWMLKAAGWLLL